MKKYFWFILLCFITIACNEKQPLTANNMTLVNNVNVKEDTKIIKTKITNKNQVSKLHKLIKKEYNVDYCCGQENTVILTFYSDTIKMGLYFVDTSSFKDKVIISPTDYNNCLELEKNKWNEFIETESN